MHKCIVHMCNVVSFDLKLLRKLEYSMIHSASSTIWTTLAQFAKPDIMACAEIFNVKHYKLRNKI